VNESPTQPQPQTATPPRARFELGWSELWLLLSFAATVLLFDRAFAHCPYRRLVPPQVMTNQLQLLAQELRSEPVDVLILGSSRVQAAIDPAAITALLSHRPDEPHGAVRLPLQGMRTFALWKLVDDVVAAAPPRELLVIAIEERMFYVAPQEATDSMDLRLLAESQDLFDLDWTALDGSQRSQLGLAPFRGVQAPWNLPLMLAADTAEYVEHLHQTRGLPTRDFRTLSKRELALAGAMRDEIQGRATPDTEVEFREFELQCFRRTLERLADYDCKVVFTRLPVAREYAAEQRTQLARFEREIVAEVRAAGFRYLDLNQFEHLLRPEFFKNPTHTNVLGMAHTSRCLAFELICPEVLGPPPAGFDPRPEYERVLRGEAAVEPGPAPAATDGALVDRFRAALAELERDDLTAERRGELEREARDLRRLDLERRGAASPPAPPQGPSPEQRAARKQWLEDQLQREDLNPEERGEFERLLRDSLGGDSR
jgi:hypothetical protein